MRSQFGLRVVEGELAVQGEERGVGLDEVAEGREEAERKKEEKVVFLAYSTSLPTVASYSSVLSIRKLKLRG